MRPTLPIGVKKGWDRGKKDLGRTTKECDINEIKKITISAMLVAVAVVYHHFQSRSDRADAFLSNIYATCWLQCF